VIIELTQGKVTTIDDADWPLLEPFNWCVARASGGRFYAIRTARPRLMHQVITGYPRTDHRDGDGLNNHRSNLRQVTHAENMRNRFKRCRSASVYKGVTPSWSRWKALIKVDGVQLNLGTFATELNAAIAYDIAARALHGEHAALNFPGVGERAALLPPIGEAA